MKTTRTYKAQALAIIMIILVVASIIGFSVFSRLITQKKATLQERVSSEALEVADMILNNFLLSKPEDWEEKITQDFLYVEKYDGGDVESTEPNNGVIQSEEGMGMQRGTFNEGDSSSNAITKLTKALGHELNLQNLGICPLSEHNNEYTLKLSKTDEDTEFALRPGETFVFPIRGKSLGPTCSINISFPGSENKSGGFTVNRIYAKEGGGIKEYDYPDTTNHCFSSTGIQCNNSNFSTPQGGWDYFKKNTVLKISEPFRGTPFERIQLTAIGEELIFKFSMSESCSESIELWQLRASATCNRTYRAKEVIVPDVGWSYSIFNYVLFNGQGNISSGQ